MSVKDLIDQIIAIYQNQIEHYKQLTALYEQEKQNLIQGRGEEKADQIMVLVARKNDLMQCLEAQRTQAKDLQQQLNEQLGIHDFRLSLLKQNILPEQKDLLRNALDQIGKELLKIRALDTENQKLLKEYIMNHQATSEQKNVDQAVEIYRQSVLQGKLLKKR